MILIPIFVIGHKSNDFRFMDYKSKIKIINHKSMNWLSNKLFYTIGITLLCGGLHAQSLAEAKKLYNEGKYAEAKPAFEKLVKQAPSNSSYNHWYGVCCYETGDLTGAEKHLKVAVKRKVQEAYRYMSEVYYKTYRFDEAGEMLEEYINLLAKKKQDPQSFEIQLPMTVPETIGRKSFQNSSGAKCITSTHQSAAPAMKTPLPCESDWRR